MATQTSFRIDLCTIRWKKKKKTSSCCWNTFSCSWANTPQPSKPHVQNGRYGDILRTLHSKQEDAHWKLILLTCNNTGSHIHRALTLMTLLRHSSATILTSDSASSLHSRNSSIAMPKSFWNSGEFLSKREREIVTGIRGLGDLMAKCNEGSKWNFETIKNIT